ncbi:hypothetical protein JUN65_08265 [Gluconacetobacter azotocaptans]|uniref:hypothetical protein n=1 Tax=Gluconacetobacter azotocaptans TaxID=142834 RepID=UPI00195E6187|nr:hypothetical protein [Gluconacetobacter azotocaptans]MBM9401579.1 hypothetical protein [Gluconacetobacter azotocaptans]
MREITFTLARPTPVLNVLMRQNRWDRAKNKRALGREIAAALGGRLPSEPIEWARVTVTRFSVGMPDQDGAAGGIKDLLDVLTTPWITPKGQRRNKFGLGLIRDDDADRCLQVVLCVKCRAAEQRTEVVIEEVGGCVSGKISGPGIFLDRSLELLPRPSGHDEMQKGGQ